MSTKGANSALFAELSRAKEEIKALVKLHRTRDAEKAKLQMKLAVLKQEVTKQPIKSMSVSEQTSIMLLMETRIVRLLSAIHEQVIKRTNSFVSNHDALMSSNTFGSIKCGCFSPAMFRSLAIPTAAQNMMLVCDALTVSKTTSESEISCDDMSFAEQVAATEMKLVAMIEDVHRAVTAQADEFARCLGLEEARIEELLLAAETFKKSIAVASSGMELRLETLLRPLRDMMSSDSSQETPADEPPVPAECFVSTQEGIAECFPFARYLHNEPTSLKEVEDRLAALVEASTSVVEQRMYEMHENISHLDNRIEELSRELSGADRTAEISVLEAAFEDCIHDLARDKVAIERLRLDLETSRLERISLVQRISTLQGQLGAHLRETSSANHDETQLVQAPTGSPSDLTRLFETMEEIHSLIVELSGRDAVTTSPPPGGGDVVRTPPVLMSTSEAALHTSQLSAMEATYSKMLDYLENALAAAQQELKTAQMGRERATIAQAAFERRHQDLEKDLAAVREEAQRATARAAEERCAMQLRLDNATKEADGKEGTIAVLRKQFQSTVTELSAVRCDNHVLTCRSDACASAAVDLGNQLEEAQYRLEQSRQVGRKAADECGRLGDALRRTQRERDALHASLAAAADLHDGELTDMLEEIRSALAHSQACQADVARLEGRVATLESDAAEREAQAVALHTKYEEVCRTLEQTRSSFDAAVEQSLAGLRGELDRAHRLMEELREEMNSAHDDASVAQSAILVLRADAKSTSAALGETRAQLRLLETERAALQTALDARTAAATATDLTTANVVAAKESTIAALSTALSETNRTCEDLEARLGTQQTSLQRETERVLVAEARAAALGADLARRNTQYDEVRAAHTAYVGQKEGGLPAVRVALENALSSEVCGRVIAFLETHFHTNCIEKLSTAFATAVRQSAFAAVDTQALRVRDAETRETEMQLDLAALRTALATRFDSLAKSGDIQRAEICAEVEEQFRGLAMSLVKPAKGMVSM